ncbi:permease [Agreia pratensis]|uniref:permease n=1 Tax=Agreia pratensis TaxID=150121 RepID=UPI00188A8A67|nr:permease [Agreia pratensis]MBF4633426.1 permease [Agreia pratensis]
MISSPPLPAAPARATSRHRRGVIGFGIGLAVTAAVFATRVFAPSSTADQLPNIARDFLTLSISVVVESIPFVFLGIILSIVVQIWLPESLMQRVLPQRPVLRRAVMSLLGVLLPVCECGNVPLTRGMMVKGLTVAESMTFLLAAPILNPVTIVTTYQAFGWDNGILAARIIGGFLIANLIGWLFSKHPRPEELLTRGFEATCRVGHDHSSHTTRLQRSIVAFSSEASAMLPALFIGSAIAGLIQVGVSRDVLIALGSNPIWSVLALMTLAFVIAICSNVDAFFILSFGSTFMPGAIVAFLVFGAMVDVKMLALLRTTFTTSTLARLTAVVALASLVLGLGVNLIA